MKFKNSGIASFPFRALDLDFPRDFCSFFWKSVGGYVLLLGMLAVVGFALFAMVVNPLLYLLGGPSIPGFARVFLVVDAGVLLIVALTYLFKFFTLSDSQFITNTKEAYRGVKEKYCPVVEWEG